MKLRTVSTLAGLLSAWRTLLWLLLLRFHLGKVKVKAVDLCIFLCVLPSTDHSCVSGGTKDRAEPEGRGWVRAEGVGKLS